MSIESIFQSFLAAVGLKPKEVTQPSQEQVDGPMSDDEALSMRSTFKIVFDVGHEHVLEGLTPDELLGNAISHIAEELEKTHRMCTEYGMYSTSVIRQRACARLDPYPDVHERYSNWLAWFRSAKNAWKASKVANYAKLIKDSALDDVKHAMSEDLQRNVVLICSTSEERMRVLDAVRELLSPVECQYDRAKAYANACARVSSSDFFVSSYYDHFSPVDDDVTMVTIRPRLLITHSASAHRVEFPSFLQGLPLYISRDPIYSGPAPECIRWKAPENVTPQILEIGVAHPADSKLSSMTIRRREPRGNVLMPELSHQP